MTHSIPRTLHLRRAYELKLPIIWFVGVESGIYEPLYPVWVVGDDPTSSNSRWRSTKASASSHRVR